jgi:hypothetical protein
MHQYSFTNRVYPMKSLDYDLGYLSAGVDNLERYLLSDDVFWAMGAKPPEGEPDFPQLTLDNMLLMRTRVSGRQLSPDQANRVEDIISRIDFYRSKWTVAWEGKASQCYHVRERLWRNFIQEYQDNPQDNVDRYPYEVRVRVMLELLKPELRRQIRNKLDLLLDVDDYLKKILIPSKFIWEPEIQAGFPEKGYWFLYGMLPTLINSR